MSIVIEGANENARQYAALYTAYQAATAQLDNEMYAGDVGQAETPTDVKSLYAATVPTKHFDNETYGLFTTKETFSEIKTKLKTAKDTSGKLVYAMPPDSTAKHRTHKELEQLKQKNIANWRHHSKVASHSRSNKRSSTRNEHRNNWGQSKKKI